MSSPSPPPVPAAAPIIADQTAANKATAITNYGLNAANQTTPYGSLTYRQEGTWDDGTPRFSSTQMLSPEQEALYKQYTDTQQKLGGVAGTQIDKIGGILGTPFNVNDAATNQQYDLYRKMLDPVWNQRENALDNKLANQGIPMGSEARTNAMRDFGMTRDNAYNSAAITSRANAVQEALAQRNQPFNEIASLLGTSGVTQPNWTQTPNVNVQPTDVASINQQNYANQFNNYNAQLQSQNAMLGGLFGLAGAGVTGGASLLRQPSVYNFGR